VTQFTTHPNDYRIWDHYDALKLPVLIMRGEQSDLVLPKTVNEMKNRGPGILGLLKCIEVPDCGHAPALNVAQQLEHVTTFIDSV
jgi:pimeloyl-ACP methyl ester carboxylesterase